MEVVSLEVMKARFATWRAGKTSPSEAIPNELWDGAAHLALSSSVFHVSKALNLDYTALKKKARSLEQPGKQIDQPTFVRTRLDAMLSPERPMQDSEWHLTIERSDGTTLKVSAPRADREDLLQVAIQFIR